MRSVLTKDQKHSLLDIINEQFGSSLEFDQFADAVFGLFENIAGFETIPHQSANRLVNQLWRKYHHGHKQTKNRRKEVVKEIRPGKARRKTRRSTRAGGQS